MKKTGLSLTAFIIAVALLAPLALLAQEEKTDKADKETKVKKEAQQITITRKGDKDEKVVVEIKGDKITINGKPLDEYKDNGGDISVKLNNLKDLEFLAGFPAMGKMRSLDAYSGNTNFNFFNEDANRAMLGVTTEETEEGVKIQDITKESGAEKAGLKEGDVITKIGEKKIENPDDLSKTIREHKPGDKVAITYLRDKKLQTTTAELTKWKGVNLFGTTGNGQSYKMDLGGMDFDRDVPRAYTIPRTTVPRNVPGYLWSGGTPKLGLSVQDTDDGKGVKVIEVDDESNAKKAGIKQEDVVMEVDGKAVNSTDDMVKVIKESKEKISVMIKLQRAGKMQNIEVKMPRKIKTADL